MADIAYVSEVDLERIAGPLRVAHLPGEPNPVYFSTHGPVAKHYGVTRRTLRNARNDSGLYCRRGRWLTVGHICRRAGSAQNRSR